MSNYKAMRQAVLGAHVDMKFHYIFFTMRQGLTEEQAEVAWESEKQRLTKWVAECDDMHFYP